MTVPWLVLDVRVQCHPYGTRTHFSPAPGTSDPGFHIPPLAGLQFCSSVGGFAEGSRGISDLEGLLAQEAVQFRPRFFD